MKIQNYHQTKGGARPAQCIDEAGGATRDAQGGKTTPTGEDHEKEEPQRRNDRPPDQGRVPWRWDLGGPNVKERVTHP
jgi:hypothetical protein